MVMTKAQRQKITGVGVSAMSLFNIIASSARSDFAKSTRRLAYDRWHDGLSVFHGRHDIKKLKFAQSWETAVSYTEHAFKA
jgi:hypothetical protein